MYYFAAPPACTADNPCGDREADCLNDDANCQTGMECENKRCAPELMYGEDISCCAERCDTTIHTGVTCCTTGAGACNDGKWIFQDLSIIQILREINFGESRSSKTMFLAIFGALTLLVWSISAFQKCKNS